MSVSLCYRYLHKLELNVAPLSGDLSGKRVNIRRGWNSSQNLHSLVCDGSFSKMSLETLLLVNIIPKEACIIPGKKLMVCTVLVSYVGISAWVMWGKKRVIQPG